VTRKRPKTNGPSFRSGVLLEFRDQGLPPYRFAGTLAPKAGRPKTQGWKASLLNGRAVFSPMSGNKARREVGTPTSATPVIALHFPVRFLDAGKEQPQPERGKP